MANRNWASGGKIYSMHVKPVIITATVQIGATGAVSSIVGSAVKSVTRVSQGVYKVKCQPATNFPRLYSAVATMQSPASGFSGISTIEIQHNPNASVATSDGMELTVTCLAPTSSSVTTLIATDPASGSALNIMAMLSDSSVIIDGE